MTKAIKVGLVDRNAAVVEFVVTTANYLLAEETSRLYMEIIGLERSDYPYAMFADVEIIEPIG